MFRLQNARRKPQAESHKVTKRVVKTVSFNKCKFGNKKEFSRTSTTWRRLKKLCRLDIILTVQTQKRKRNYFKRDVESIFRLCCYVSEMSFKSISLQLGCSTSQDSCHTTNSTFCFILTLELLYVHVAVLVPNLSIASQTVDVVAVTPCEWIFRYGTTHRLY